MNAPWMKQIVSHNIKPNHFVDITVISTSHTLITYCYQTQTKCCSLVLLWNLNFVEHCIDSLLLKSSPGSKRTPTDISHWILQNATWECYSCKCATHVFSRKNVRCLSETPWTVLDTCLSAICIKHYGRSMTWTCHFFDRTVKTPRFHILSLGTTHSIVLDGSQFMMVTLAKFGK